MEEYDRTRVRSQGSELGETASPVHSESSQHPSVLELSRLLSSRYREGTFYPRVYDLLQRKGEVRESFLCLLFLEFPHLKIFNMPRGRDVLNPMKRNHYFKCILEKSMS